MSNSWKLAGAFSATAFALLGAVGAADAACGGQPYIVKAGDTVFSIAQQTYGDPEKWTLIYYANEAKLQASVFQVTPGDQLKLPCEEGVEASVSPSTQPAPARQGPADADLKLLTGSNYAPFTDADWPAQGMLTEIVNAALAAAPDKIEYSITWENDWSKHMFPLLDSKEFDMGFPWYMPPCDQMPDNARCANFHFSDPLVEVMVMLFVRTGSGMVYRSDADIVGKSICRPEGFLTFDLERAERRWLETGAVRLVQARDAGACFDLLMSDDVDAVSLDVFQGAQIIKDRGLNQSVTALEKPLSTAGLHVIISKRHWRGTTFLYRFNAGLAALKQSDRYGEIVSRHLGIFWDQIQTQ